MGNTLRARRAQRAHLPPRQIDGHATLCPSYGICVDPAGIRQRAFSLVEVLVVLVILGLAATFTTLGFERLEEDRLTKQAGHLSSWLQQLSDDAMLDGAVYGAGFNAESRRLEPAFYFDNRWWPMTGEDVDSEKLAENLTLIVDGDPGRDPVKAGTTESKGRQLPDILFLPSGLSFPETLRLEDGNERVAVIERNQDGLYTWSLER